MLDVIKVLFETCHLSFGKYMQRLPIDDCSVDDFYPQFKNRYTAIEQFEFVLNMMESRGMLTEPLRPIRLLLQNDTRSIYSSYLDSGRKFLEEKIIDPEAMHNYTCRLVESRPRTKYRARVLNERSRLLYYSGLYIESLDDLNRALMPSNEWARNPDRLWFKMMNRRARISRLTESSDVVRTLIQSGLIYVEIDSVPQILEIPADRPELLGGAHELYPTFSKHVWFGQTPNMGMGVFTSQELKPGDIIAVEEFHVGAPFAESFYICNYPRCLRISMAVHFCERCTLVYYCSTYCLEKDYYHGHNYECQILIAIKMLPGDSYLNPFVLKWFLWECKEIGLDQYCSYVKMMSNHDIDPNLKQEFKRGQYGKFLSAYSLDIDDDCVSTKIALYFNCIAVEMLTFLKLAGFEIPEHQLSTVGISLVRMQQIILTNFQNTMLIDCDNFEENIVFSLYPVIMNQMNHSCDPNLIIDSLPGKKTMVLKALKPIQKNDQLFISYDSNIQNYDKNVRNKFLRDVFNFECCCQPCKENWTTIPREISCKK